MSRKPVRKAAGKAAAARGKSRLDAKRERLLEELGEALSQLDEQGLAFLLNQAHVLIHNLQVEKINRELAELDKKNRAARKSAAVAAAPLVRIDEANNRKTFFLSIGGARKVLALDELKRLVRICYTAESKSAALRQLYTVLSRERSDILADAKIGGASSPLIESLFYAIREKYRLEDR